MDIIRPHTLSGFMELLPEPQLRMNAILDILRDTYERYGFTPLDTPTIESAEVLLAKGGGETEKQIYRFQKGDSDLALRFDLTVPLAKYAALNYGQLTFPFRRYQIGKVYRGERAQRGRFREFYQADIDVIGDGKLDVANEAEMPAIICDAFHRLGLTRFVIRFNNRKVLNGLFDLYGLGDRAATALQTIDKLEKIGRDKVEEILVTELSLPAAQAASLLDVIVSNNPFALRGQTPLLDEGLQELETVTGLLPQLGVAPENWALDLTIARGLDYYTGTVYETQLTDYPELGSVCSGGRYDNLAAYYINKPLPGVGVSIGVTRLFFVLQEQGLLNPEALAAPCDALVIPMGPEQMSFAAAVATTLRRAGVRTQLYNEQKKPKQKFAYADKLGIPFAVILGEDEQAQQLVSLKNLRSGEQQLLSAPAAADLILRQSAATVPPIREK